MLAIRIPFGQGSPSARKFSTVEELVNVIKSAPSCASCRRAPLVSRVSGTVRYANASSTIAPNAENSLKRVPRLFCAHEENPHVFDAALLFKFFHHRFRHEFVGLKIHM